jgi:RNA polymerase sigma-70 factor (ECF subfamily)
MSSELDGVTTSLRQAHAHFGEVVESLRPALHRYCSRMTGSVLDGEDLVQEVLAQAFYRLALNKEQVSLKPWLFTLAHHKCVDFLRSRSAAPEVEIDADENSEPAMATEFEQEIEAQDLARRAFSSLVLELPPRERAAIILKEVLGEPLPEIARILETSVGSIKSALHRGREKLAVAKEKVPLRREAPSQAVARYLEVFNRRDWVGLQSLLVEEVNCEVVGRVHLRGRTTLENNYLVNYEKLPFRWKLALIEIDGEPTIACLRDKDGQWVAHHAVRLEWRDEHVVRIRDYVHVRYLLEDAQLVMSLSADASPETDFSRTSIGELR